MLRVFEGGQMPLVRRIPKRGFHNRWAENVAVVNLGTLEKHFQNGDEVNAEALKAKRIVRGSYDLLKVLANGELTKNLKVSAHRFSGAAREKIEKAGGQALVLPGKAPVVKNKMKSKAR
jgi:large subunit ribosomal protein L15